MNSNLRQEVNYHIKKGHLLRSENKYDEAIVEYQKCLKIRESVLGRYHDDIAFSYKRIGDCYCYKNDYKNAIVVYRAFLRTEIYLNDQLFYPNAYTRMMEKSLKNNGVEENKIKAYDKNLCNSIKYEKDGDNYRKKGEFNNAIEYYHKAIAIEKDSIGNDITLAFLYRKIAYILAIKDNDNIKIKKIDWIQLHCIGKNTNACMNLPIMESNIEKIIQLGDQYHQDCKYDLALQQYEQIANVTTCAKLIDNKSSNLETASCNQQHTIEQVTMKIEQIQKEIIVQFDGKINNLYETMKTLMKKLDDIQNQSLDQSTNIKNIINNQHDKICEYVNNKIKHSQYDTISQIDNNIQCMIKKMKGNNNENCKQLQNHIGRLITNDVTKTNCMIKDNNDKIEEMKSDIMKYITDINSQNINNTTTNHLANDIDTTTTSVTTNNVIIDTKYVNLKKRSLVSENVDNVVDDDDDDDDILDVMSHAKKKRKLDFTTCCNLNPMVVFLCGIIASLSFPRPSRSI